MLPIGLKSAVPIIQAKTKRNKGLRNFPTQVRILPGRSEKNKSSAKKTDVKIKSARDLFIPAGIIAEKPDSNGTVKQRGHAKSGPSVI